MKIGLVGMGMVGSAVKYGFETKQGHRLMVHDIKLTGTSIRDVYDGTDVIFVCVSTPQKQDGSCDVSNVEQVCSEINQMAESKDETKDVVIKSTMVPGTLNIMESRFTSLRLAVNPEFLLERAAIHDFCHQDICVIGTKYDDLYKKIVDIHGNLVQEFIRTTPTNAETVKYFCNAFNSTRIVFANMFYDLSNKVGADYGEVKRIAVKRHNMIDAYLDCNEHLRGFGGACLPKDTKALFALTGKLGLHYDFLKGVLDDNERINHETA